MRNTKLRKEKKTRSSLARNLEKTKRLVMTGKEFSLWKWKESEARGPTGFSCSVSISPSSFSFPWNRPDQPLLSRRWWWQWQRRRDAISWFSFPVISLLLSSHSSGTSRDVDLVFANCWGSSTIILIKREKKNSVLDLQDGLDLRWWCSHFLFNEEEQTAWSTMFILWTILWEGAPLLVDKTDEKEEKLCIE